MDITNESCGEFLAALASNAPTPGGGGAAALVGAVGMALGNMVGNLTVGKKTYAAVEDEIKQLLSRCDALQKDLLDMVAQDAACFAPLAKAYGISKDDPTRPLVLEQALAVACSAPLRIMELCCEAIAQIRVFAEKGSRMAVSDAGCAAVICKAALQSASLNVFINTKSMQNREAAEARNLRAKAMLDEYCAMADEIFTAVRAKL
ncbi:MAG: cyclodeaminase/cyclohydrolase family protein [Oscillospiraceae bacterium]|jgi:formiminotetrahydrofolate cyclodeaminase|nr:cyclodeaminase/cyclohydrolase family protein [Oscillospiraceae bacterium]